MAKLRDTNVRDRLEVVGSITSGGKEVSKAGHSHSLSELSGINEAVIELMKKNTAYNSERLNGLTSDEYLKSKGYQELIVLADMEYPNIKNLLMTLNNKNTFKISAIKLDLLINHCPVNLVLDLTADRGATYIDQSDSYVSSRLIGFRFKVQNTGDKFSLSINNIDVFAAKIVKFSVINKTSTGINIPDVTQLKTNLVVSTLAGFNETEGDLIRIRPIMNYNSISINGMSKSFIATNFNMKRFYGNSNASTFAYYPVLTDCICVGDKAGNIKVFDIRDKSSIKVYDLSNGTVNFRFTDVNNKDFDSSTNLLIDADSVFNGQYNILALGNTENNFFYPYGCIDRLDDGSRHLSFTNVTNIPDWVYAIRDHYRSLLGLSPLIRLTGKINGVTYNGTSDIEVPAAKLKTPVNINGVQFDGTRDITITARANGGNADSLGNLNASQFVKQTDVGNAANKIVKYNDKGQLEWPNGYKEYFE